MAKFFFAKLPVTMTVVYFNVCREKGSLLSFVYKFGRVAHQCC